MRPEDLRITAAELAELEAYGERAAAYFERDFAASDGADLPPLVELRRVRYGRARLERDAVEAVGAARRDGASWHKIGLALGTTAEAARRRYRPSTAA
ncbi:MAG: hypothetical protein LBG60_15960 [Bifidobacteriaceae bacterium]|jgi:hypothetical protein|nr:hypothetical protein [Bifidobacteriaceae bacterium]